MNRCNCVLMLSAAEHSYIGWSVDSPHKSFDKDSLSYLHTFGTEHHFLSEQVPFAFWCFCDSYAKTDTGLFVLQKAALHKNLKGGDADDCGRSKSTTNRKQKSKQGV